MRKAIGSLLALSCWVGCGMDEPELDPGAVAAPLYISSGITSVATVAGFTQIRHGYEGWLENFADRLVLTGAGLAGVTEVMVGPLPATIVSASPTQVLVDVDIPHGFPARPLEVTASGPGWLAASPNPITITPVIVAPGAPLGGRGTHQSPAALCDPTVAMARARDTIELLAGTHTCTSLVEFFDAGMEIRGAGVGTTTIAPGFSGFNVSTGNPEPAPTRLHDLTILAPAGPVLALYRFDGPPSPLLVDRVTVSGGTGGAVAVYDYTADGGLFNASNPVQIHHLSYDAAGTAIYLEFASGAISNATIQHCATGIDHHYGAGNVAVSGSTISSCTTGVSLGQSGLPWWESTPGLSLQGSQIHAVVGASLPRGNLAVAGSSVTGTGMFGIYLADGGLDLVAGAQVTSPHTAVYVSGLGDQYVTVDSSGAALIGGQVGLDFSSSESTSLTLRGTLVQGGNYGLRINTYDVSQIDLGTASWPGNNQLVGSVFAYSVGSDYFGTYQAVGTLLNGNSYAGQTISGPASLPPDYDISAFEIATQF